MQTFRCPISGPLFASCAQACKCYEWICSEVLRLPSFLWAPLSTPWGKDWRWFNPNFTALGSAWHQCVPCGVYMNECLYEGWGCGQPCGGWGWLGSCGCYLRRFSETVAECPHSVMTQVVGIRENQGGRTLTWCHLVELIPRTGVSFKIQARWGREPNAID